MDELYNDMVNKGLVTPIEFGYLKVNQYTYHVDKVRPLFYREVLAYTGYTHGALKHTEKIWRWN